MFHVAGPVLFLTALSTEAAVVRRGIGHRIGIRIQAIGIRCNRGIDQQLLDDARLIVVAGLAGALDPGLAIGDVVLDDPTGLVSELGPQAAPPTIPWTRGLIHSAYQLAATPAEKSDLGLRTGAIAVDMEQRLIRERAKVPVIGLRTISDRALDPVEPVVMSLVDDLGRPRPLVIATTLIRRPRLIGHLRRLQVDSRFALGRLETAVSRLLDTIGPRHPT
jgi:hypothetical protein